MPLKLDTDKVKDMTGWELLEATGIKRNGSWCYHDAADFENREGRTFTVYATAGRGRYRGTTYVHVGGEIALRVKDPDGKITILQDWLQVRGKASAKVGTYREVR